MSINTSNTSLSKLQRIYDTQQTILDEMKDNDILLPGISAEDFKKINEAIGKLNLEEGQPDPVGDDAAVNSPFSNVDNALGKFSQNRDMDVKGLLDTYGVTAKDALDRARSLAQYEDTLGLAVSAVGPTIGKVLEAIRRDPRQTYKEMIAPLAALDYYSHEPTYDLPQPTSVGKGTRATPDTKDTFFGFNVDKKPVDPVPTDPYSPYSSEPDPVSTMTPTEQAQTMASSRLEGIGEVEAPTGSFSDDTAAQWGGYDGSDQGGGTGDTGGDIGDTSSMNTGGRVGALIQHLRTGGDVENAETNMGNANIPMGIVNDPDGAPSPFSGGTGVEDDLDMDVEAGSYVLNAESVQLIGISDINAVIRDAYSIAAALGQPMPQDYDPQNKVPIRISNGEAVIPKPLVDIIGLDKLEKWNKKGLELRKQKEKMMAQQQQAQPPQQQQVAAEAPMQQQMGQLMDKGGEVEEGLLISLKEIFGFGFDEFNKLEDDKRDQLTEVLLQAIKDSGKSHKEIKGIIKKANGGKIQKLNEGGRVQKLFDNANRDLYTYGKPYDEEDMDTAIETVSTVLGQDPEYHELTATYLREIANAESTFGSNPKTNKKESNIVGPWQVGMGDNQAYTEILRRLNPNSGVHRPKLQENLDKFIATSWGKKIDWLNLSKKDMMNPLINATIARLYISTMDEDAIPADKTKRAELWERVYNTKADKEGTVAHYLKMNDEEQSWTSQLKSLYRKVRRLFD